MLGAAIHIRAQHAADNNSTSRELTPLSESHRDSNADQFLLSDRQHHSKRPIDTANKWLRRRTIIRTDFGNRGTGEHSGTRSDARRFL
ncbi:hypothetical protein [Actinomyces naeslundii]|uniref:Uncharacterized protein n=1 Tax=Actinomyces naeslundii TaxID=1655 RepID=A0AA47IMH5_ACTNA|nr:hypothetical protein [Actinomyces naeslundii]WAL43877.1 hypothetical protein OFA60_04825 [Actinomyces naeslundii]